MHRIICLFIMGCYTVIGLGCKAQASAAPPPDLTQAIMARMAKTKVPGLALARIEQGTVAWIRVYGEASPGRPVTARTPFNVASLTKPVFATLVLHQIAQSQLSLDKPLSSFWVDPDIADDPRVHQLTARMALSHQTGFPNWRGNNRLTFQFDPGQGTDYSGEGFEFLRRALQNATGKSLPELMADLQKRAKMPTASFGWTAELAGRIANGYNEAGKPFKMDYLKERGPAAASSLFCSIEDYANFTAWVSRGAELPTALFTMMQQDQVMHHRPIDQFGLGWRVVPAKRTTVLMHDGREQGVRTLVFVVPNDRSGMVLLTNSSNGELMMRMLTKAVIPRGSAIVDAIDANAWLFASSMPANVQARMLQFIASSPSFVSRLLHGAEVSLVRSHFRRAEQQAEIEQAIDRIALALLHGALTSEKVLTFFKTMGQPHEQGFQLYDQLTRDQAQQWRTSLLALTKEADEARPDDAHR